MYRINYSGGGSEVVGTLAEAARRLGRVAYCRNGSIVNRPLRRELDDAGRILVWADRAAADGPHGMGDAGANAIAEIVRAWG